MYILTHKYTSMCMYKDINPRKKAIITDVFRILRTQITKMLMEAQTHENHWFANAKSGNNC